MNHLIKSISRNLLRVPPYWVAVGLAHAKYGQLHQAIACFREALRIRPDFKEARHNLDLAENPGKTQ
jgi:tetratricopeptide (TPR) repeat protein